MDKLDKKLAIIGIGHIGKALKEGLLKSGFKKENLLLSNNLRTNLKVSKEADWILLAVKPLIVGDVILEIKGGLKDKIILSVAAVLNISSIQKYSDNTQQKIIRLMPNISVSCNEGVIGFYANKYVSSEEKKEVKNLLKSLGEVVELEKEEDLDKLTLISACGPAIVSYFIEMLSKSGQSLGLARKISQQAAIQTFEGTLAYLKKTNQKPLELLAVVATKGGVTEEIIKLMEEYDINSLFEKSIKGGYSKITELKKKL